MPDQQSDTYAQDVRTRGIEAVMDRRRARQYGLTNQRAGFEYGAQTGYFPSQGNDDLYSRWLEQTSARPAPTMGYTVGQKLDEKGNLDGEYGGFKTQGMLQAAIKGRAEALRDQDRQQFSALDAMAQGKLDEINTLWHEREYELANQDYYKDRDLEGVGQPKWHEVPNKAYDPLFGTDPNGGGATSWEETPESVAARRALENDVVAERYSRMGEKEFRKDQHEGLNDWLATESDRFLDQQDFAAQATNTPLAHYAQQAGAEYGVDPAIIGGWYPADTAIGDYRDQRDIESINTYGMPYSEYQAALAEMERQAMRESEDATEQAEAAALDQRDAAIFDATGMNPTTLASQAGVAVDDLVPVLSTDGFAGYVTELEDARADWNATGDPTLFGETVQSVLAQAGSQDPVLFAVLQAMYADFIPDEFSLYEDA